MATGVLIQVTDQEAFGLSGITANLPNDLQWSPGVQSTVLDPGVELYRPGGTATKHLVNPLGVEKGTGYRSPLYFDDYYNQIWLIPASLDFGAIGSESSKTFMVWNAYWHDAQTLTSIQVENGNGMQLSGPSTPTVYKPLQYINYTVTAKADGPASVATEYSFTFANGASFSIPVVGTRAKPWLLSPNWNSPYRIKYDYKTEIITSRSGREQRIAHRMTPRKTLTYSVLLSGKNVRGFNELMWSWQDRAFVMPEVTRKAKSETGMAPLSDYTDVVEPVPSWMKPNVIVMLDNGYDREIRVIESVTESRVTFKSKTGTAWPAGTVIYYAVTGYFDTSVSTSRRTSTTVTLDLGFNVAPGSEPPFDSGTPVLTIGGREIFDKRPNWSSDVPVTHRHEVDELDYGYGVVSRFSPIAFGTMLRQHTYLARDFSEAEAMLQFFSRNLGQQGEFYAPTWEHDVIPKITAAASTATVRIAGRGFYDAYGASTVTRGLAVRFKDGSMVYRLIQSIDLVNDNNGEDSLITVTQTWGREISLDTIQYISWMLLCRFASDSLTLEFVSDSVAQFQFTMMSLENLAPEA